MNISENYILAKPQSSILNSTSDQVEQKISRNHSDYLTILKENNLLDDNQFIKEYLFTNSSIPPLNQEEVKFIQGILDKQLLVQGRSLKFPLNLNFTLRKLLNEFNDYPISFFGSRLWNSLGLGYMERVFENGFHDKKLNIPTKDLISPLIQSKTHKKSDFDINIFIPSLSDLKKFNQFLLDKFPKLKWDKVMNYLSMRQARAKTKELGNYERQLLENVNLTDLSDSELFEIYLNITCFESASNVKEEHKEFYYRSFKTETDEGLTLDITFIVDIHQTFAFIYQGLYLELNPFLKVDLPYVTPKSYYPNIFQVIHHNNAGIIAPYENFENFDERELKIFLAALRVGFNRINSKLERKITNNLEFFELCSKVLTSKRS